LLAPLRHSLRVTFRERRWVLPGKTLKVHADVDGAVEEAIAASQDGGLAGRLIRYIGGGSVDERVSANVTYSESAVNRFVRRVADAIDREPRDATVVATGSSVSVVPQKNGRKLRDNLLTDQLSAAVLNARADHTITALTHPIKPEVTASEVAEQYPTYLTLDRSSFTLRLWEDLEPAKAYTVAVG